MRLKRHNRLPPAIALTPLVDVVFILLIFFMLASSFLHWRAVDLSMPDRVAAEAGDDAKQALVVGLLADGNVTLAGQPIAKNALGTAVTARLKAEPDLRMVIRPEESVSLQRTVDMLDLMRRVGIVDVSLSAGE